MNHGISSELIVNCPPLGGELASLAGLMSVLERSRTTLISWHQAGAVRGKKIHGSWFLNVDDCLEVATLSLDDLRELGIHLTTASQREAGKAWVKRQQALSLEMSELERYGAEWEATEDAILDDDTRGTTLERAAVLGRTYYANVSRRVKIHNELKRETNSSPSPPDDWHG